MPEAQAIAVAILDVEVSTPVGLVAYIARNLDTLGLELRTQLIGIIDPDICIPRFTLGIYQPVWAHGARLGVLGKHDDRAAAGDHAKGWRHIPKSVVSEAQLVSIKVCCCDDVIHHEVRGNTPAGPTRFDIARHARLPERARQFGLGTLSFTRAFQRFVSRHSRRAVSLVSFCDRHG
jgi:hypothetical protein